MPIIYHGDAHGPGDDLTGPELTPGDPEQCKGNGEHTTSTGAPIEICCDECDYYLRCYPQND